MRTARAVKKWPASWMRIRKASPPMATTMCTASVNQLPCERGGSLPRLRVDRDELVDVLRGHRVGRVQRPLDHLRDAEERQAPVQEGGHRYLVGGVEDARSA